MRTPLKLLICFTVSCLFIINAIVTSDVRAQSRDFSSGRLILDDGTGHKIRISVPTTGWPGPGMYDWVLPIPPAGVDAGFVQEGTLVNKYLEWDNALGYWKAVPTLGGIVGTGTDNFIPKWTAGGTTLTNSLLTDDGSTIAGANAALLLSGTTGATPASDAGTRMMWIPAKSAFRAGTVSGTQWDDASIGVSSVAMGLSTIASGAQAVAMGNTTTASGAQAIAAGSIATATANQAVAMGNNIQATSAQAVAMGNFTQATGLQAVAMGNIAKATADHSVAMGNITEATGVNSVAMGNNTDAYGANATAFGNITHATGDHSVAMGSNATASGTASIALGDIVEASGDLSVALGSITEASGEASTAMGSQTTASGLTSMAMGYQTTASGDRSTAMGRSVSTNGFAGSFIYGDASTATLLNNTAANQFMVRSTGGFQVISTLGATVPDFGLTNGALLLNGTSGTTPASGNGTRLMWIPAKAAFRAGSVFFDEWDDGSIGQNSTAIGENTKASGENSTAMGRLTSATGASATAMGDGSTASADYATAMGSSSLASGEISTAMGGSEASGDYSTSMGNATEASGRVSTAMGLGTLASGDYSTAMGSGTEASGNYSTAMGHNTTASEGHSTAMGFSTEASAEGSTAMGQDASALHDNSFVYGDGSVETSSSASEQFVVRASGGTIFYSNDDDPAPLGVSLAPGANSWASISDSNRKEQRLSIDGEAVLNKFGKLWLGSWNYKGQDPKQFRHYGPMAQEFFAAFGNDGIGVSGNNTTLASADVDGINMIAIQALIKRTEALQQENEALRERLQKLEAITAGK